MRPVRAAAERLAARLRVPAAELLDGYHRIRKEAEALRASGLSERGVAEALAARIGADPDALRGRAEELAEEIEREARPWT